MTLKDQPTVDELEPTPPIPPAKKRRGKKGGHNPTKVNHYWYLYPGNAHTNSVIGKMLPEADMSFEGSLYVEIDTAYGKIWAWDCGNNVSIRDQLRDSGGNDDRIKISFAVFHKVNGGKILRKTLYEYNPPKNLKLKY